MIGALSKIGIGIATSTGTGLLGYTAVQVSDVPSLHSKLIEESAAVTEIYHDVSQLKIDNATIKSVLGQHTDQLKTAGQNATAAADRATAASEHATEAANQASADAKETSGKVDRIVNWAQTTEQTMTADSGKLDALKRQQDDTKNAVDALSARLGADENSRFHSPIGH